MLLTLIVLIAVITWYYQVLVPENAKGAALVGLMLTIIVVTVFSFDGVWHGWPPARLP